MGKESLENKVKSWLEESNVLLKKNTSGEQYFASYKNKKVVINLVDFNLNNEMFRLNSSKQQSMGILKEFNIPHIEIEIIGKEPEEYIDKAIDFFYKYNKKCVIRGDKGVCGENTFIVSDVFSLKNAITKIKERDVKPLVSPYYEAKYEYRVYFLNGKAELVVKKIKNEETGKHNLSTGATADIVTDSLLINNLSIICSKVSAIFGLRFAAIDIMDTDEGLKVVEFGIPNIKKFASFSEKNEILARNLFLKAFVIRLEDDGIEI